MSILEEVERMFSCTHDTTSNVKRRNSNGQVVVVEQCLNCGNSLGARKKNSFNLESLELFDPTIGEAWNRNKKLYREQLAKQSRAEEKEIWDSNYELYLNSPDWEDLRQRVLIRDNYLCQGCLSKPATCVHHRSYKSHKELGEAMCFELVAFCQKCHDLCHPGKSEENGIIPSYVNGN